METKVNLSVEGRRFNIGDKVWVFCTWEGRAIENLNTVVAMPSSEKIYIVERTIEQIHGGNDPCNCFVDIGSGEWLDARCFGHTIFSSESDAKEALLKYDDIIVFYDIRNLLAPGQKKRIDIAKVSNGYYTFDDLMDNLIGEMYCLLEDTSRCQNPCKRKTLMEDYFLVEFVAKSINPKFLVGHKTQIALPNKDSQGNSVWDMFDIPERKKIKYDYKDWLTDRAENVARLRMLIYDKLCENRRKAEDE